MADEVTRVDQTVTTSNVQPVVPATTVHETTTTTTTTQTEPVAAPQNVNVNLAEADGDATSVSVVTPGTAAPSVQVNITEQ